MTRLPSVFVDSSAFFTAVNSPTGGSAKVFGLAGEKFRLLASPVVLAETERNVRKKLLPQHLERFLFLAEQLGVLDQKPNNVLIDKAKKVIAEKDAVILAEAKNAQPDFLLTLDKKHFQTPLVKKLVSPTKVVTPKQLLEELK